MSTIANWAYKVLLTIWRRGAPDEFGRATWSAPEYVLCTYKTGGANEYSDSTGVKFVPKSIYYTEMRTPDGDLIPELEIGDKIQLGHQYGNPTSAADDVRVSACDDATMFGDSEVPDYTVMT